MLEYIIFGSGFAFAAAISPGPLQAFLLSSVIQKGWQRTLPAAFAPLISDGPIILLVLLVLTRVPQALMVLLQVAGGLFLIYLAWTSYQQWKNQPLLMSASNQSVPRTLLQAVIVNILNPNPYLSWSLIMGPALMTAWNQDHAHALALVVAFYATMVMVLAGTVLLFGTTAYLTPAARRNLLLVSTILLLGLGIYQVVLAALRAGNI